MNQAELTVHILGLLALVFLVAYRAWDYLYSGTQVPQIPLDANTLKTWPQFFREVYELKKPFEIRKADRDFQPGQVWYLMEWVPESKAWYGPESHTIPGYYKGSWVKVVITYVVHHDEAGPASGIAPGFCVFGFKVLSKYDADTELYTKG
jgi:hypothetical protein